MENARTPFENTSARTAQFYYPDPNTQPGRLLAALLTGQKIDPLTGWRRLGIYRLADTVLQLRRSGWSVQNHGLRVKNRFGQTCNVGLYSLTDADIKATGSTGQIYATWVEMKCCEMPHRGAA